jgi:hypothetical protein
MAHSHWWYAHPSHWAPVMNELQPLATGRSFLLAGEARADAYRALLDFLASECESFSLVYDSPVGQTQHEYWSRLLPALVDSRSAIAWPGTQIWPRPGKDLPTLAFYRLQGLGLSILKEAPGLYSWQSPARPSDLAVYGNAGTWWLGSVAHEHRARLFVPEVLAAKFAAIPGLRLTPAVDVE